jgi:general stress protein 26
MGQKQQRQTKALMDIARDFDVVMFCTVASDGSVHARPMMVLEIDETEAWWFVTSRATGKVDELANDGHATVTLQGKKTFASLSGAARIVDDERRLEALWKGELRSWFPRGASDPDVVLLRFEPTTGEYWEHGFIDAMKLTLSQARALFTEGRAPKRGAGDHGKVVLR